MKSHESDLLELAVCILQDAAAKCTTNQLDKRDLLTMRSRVKHEGLSFLTITLPSIGQDLEQALAAGRILPTHFRSFRKRGKAPAFLQGFFARLFDSSTGRILHEPSIEALEGIRQIAYTFKKLRVDCTPKRVRTTITSFAQIEHELSTAEIRQDDADYFVLVSRVLWPNCLSGELSVSPFDTRPKHGPGATAERISGNQKYRISRWHDRLEPYFPLLHNAFSSESAYESEEFQNVTVVNADDEQPVRITPVPKTLKAPRIIAIEPVCMQYAQQAISKALVKALESNPLTAGHVNFTDQSINRKLALNASADSLMATLDLSAASDRVPLSLAIRMFDGFPDLKGAIEACRSTRAQLPSGDVIPLKKFASMGSALCFPVEAMYFYTICIGALLEKQNLPVTYSAMMSVAKDVYIYGDDIIIPTDAVETVTDHLQRYYCKVNMQKSFWTGKFRESCGMDAYDGHEVTPTYVRELRPRNRRNPKALVSWIATANLFYKRGYWQTSNHITKWCESILGVLPIVGPECAGLGKHSFQRYVSTNRWNRDLQVDEVKTWVAAPVRSKDELDGYGALTKCLLSLENECQTHSSSDKDHLVSTARHGAVALQRRWTRPY